MRRRTPAQGLANVNHRVLGQVERELFHLGGRGKIPPFLFFILLYDKEKYILYYVSNIIYTFCNLVLYKQLGARYLPFFF